MIKSNPQPQTETIRPTPIIGTEGHTARIKHSHNQVEPKIYTVNTIGRQESKIGKSTSKLPKFNPSKHYTIVRLKTQNTQYLDITINQPKHPHTETPN
jgi:hypothetical protein